MPGTVRSGFTLIELLVVIAIMAIIGAYTLSNYRSFGEDQQLKNSSLDIQNLLRQAQTSATANGICSDPQYAATWKVEFGSANTIYLKCQESVSPAILKKTLTLGTNITIQSISGSNCPATLPFIVNFTLLNGKMDFVGYSNCTSLTMTLLNSKTSSTKALTLEQGGRIYGQ